MKELFEAIPDGLVSSITAVLFGILSKVLASPLWGNLAGVLAVVAILINIGVMWEKRQLTRKENRLKDIELKKAEEG